jgi:hypothetical protein
VPAFDGFRVWGCQRSYSVTHCHDSVTVWVSVNNGPQHAAKLISIDAVGFGRHGGPVVYLGMGHANVTLP